jgi:hypothetical protein
MVSFIQLVLALCLLKAGPEDLPSGRSYLLLAAGFYGLVFVAVFSLTEWTLPPVVLAIQSLLFVAITTTLLLRMAKRHARVQQTQMAIYSSSGMLNLLILLLQHVVLNVGDSILVPVTYTFLLVLIFWSFAIDAHIYSRALDTSMWMGLFVAVMFLILNQLMITPWQVLPS